MTKETVIEVSEYSAKFRQPNKDIYEKALQFIKVGNMYDAFEVFYNSLVIANKYVDDYEIKVLFFPEIITKYLTFLTPDMLENTDTLFVLSINGKRIEIRKPDKKMFKEIFNKNMNNSLQALDYIFDNLVNEPDSIELDLIEYVSLKDIPSVLLFNKQVELKKK